MTCFISDFMTSVNRFVRFQHANKLIVWLTKYFVFPFDRVEQSRKMLKWFVSNVSRFDTERDTAKVCEKKRERVRGRKKESKCWGFGSDVFTRRSLLKCATLQCSATLDVHSRSHKQVPFRFINNVFGTCNCAAHIIHSKKYYSSCEWINCAHCHSKLMMRKRCWFVICFQYDVHFFSHELCCCDPYWI